MIQLTHVSKNYAAPEGDKEKGGARGTFGSHGEWSPAKAGEMVQALRDVSLSVDRGESVAVMGPSGCGKSTLLHIAGGLDTPSSGEVWVNRQPIHQMSEKDLSLFRRQDVGIIFQFFNLLPQLTVLENISLPLRLLGVSSVESETRATTLLEEVGLGSKSARLPSEASGGEQQRVAIARALVHRPQLVLADEPTGNLDSATSATVLAVLKDLHRTHQTTLFLVTHSVEISAAADRVIQMQDGQILT